VRTRTPLNDGWLFRPDFDDAITASGTGEDGFVPVRLPHTNVELPFNNFDERASGILSCYRRHVRLDPGDLDGTRVRLCFEGVMATASVYCNGSLAGEHRGGYTGFDVELTGLVAAGDNVVVVVVDSTERPDIPPFGGVIDYLTYGGIYREVQLEILPQAFIADVCLRSTATERGRSLAVALTVDNASAEASELAAEVSLTGPDGDVTAHSFPVRLDGAARQDFEAGFEAPGVQLWDIDSPVLYTVTTRLLAAGDAVDEHSFRTGFRDAAFTPDGFVLNGRPLKLRGLNRHQSYPYVGYAMPRSAQRADAAILKNDLGVHIVRTSHYPQSRHFLDACDELGLLVFEELPGWQHIGDADWKATALADVESMIRRDRHRPSIVLWGVRINESADDDAFYASSNALAHRLDPTRQTGGVRNFEHSTLLEDVYTYNDFAHRGGNEPLKTPAAVTGRAVPYLVTEHNGHMFPTKKFDTEQRRTEHALRHLRVLERAYATPGIAGAIGWCMADYNTHAEFGSGDRVCYHGVLDAFRLQKDAAAAYASQADGTPYLRVSSLMNPGDLDEAKIGRVYVFTNCDAVRVSLGDQVISTFLPDRRRFGHLPHPPVVIEDFIGERLEREQGLSPAAAAQAKRLLAAVVRYGDKALPLRHRAAGGWTMLRNGLSRDDVVALYNRYVSGWGSPSSEYTFDGLIGGEVVCSTILAPSSSAGLLVEPDTEELVEDETWDACRVVVRHVDTLGHDLPYSTETVTVEVDGAATLIGPANLPLLGGSTAFWIRSDGVGPIRVVVTSGRLGHRELVLHSTKSG
jgi:beta-galactosidase